MTSQFFTCRHWLIWNCEIPWRRYWQRRAQGTSASHISVLGDGSCFWATFKASHSSCPQNELVFITASHRKFHWINTARCLSDRKWISTDSYIVICTTDHFHLIRMWRTDHRISLIEKTYRLSRYDFGDYWNSFIFTFILIFFLLLFSLRLVMFLNLLHISFKLSQCLTN
jgi:hypothetical protein